MNEQINVLLNERRWADAEARVAAALAKDRLNPDLLNLHGVLLHRLSRSMEALQRFGQATERRLMFPAAWQNIEQVLAEVRDPRPRFSVTVITPTIGSPYLSRAIQSVQDQTYPLIEHAIVIDGVEHQNKVEATLPREAEKPIRIYNLPVNTGAEGFNGHRVYGALPYLVNSHFVAFLDEDNWIDQDHIATLMVQIVTRGLSWAYSLRRIVDGEGDTITDDNCESLGQWPTWNDPSVHLVDVNCYLLRRDVAIRMSPIWYRRFRDEQSPDFTLCSELLKHYPRCGTNGRSTVNYRVGATPSSVQAEFFLAGNNVMRERYGDAMPWRTNHELSMQVVHGSDIVTEG